MRPQEIINRIVKAVKSADELSNVTCVYSDSREVSENPVCGFTLCIGTGKVKFKKTDNNIDSIKTEMCLLAPTGAGGKRLSEVSLWIAEAIKGSIKDATIEVSEPRYNEVTAVLYTDIALWVEHESLLSDACTFYIDDVLVDKVVEIAVESSELAEKVPVLLNGYHFEKSKCVFYTISFTTEESLRIRETSEIKLCFEDYCEIYSGCVPGNAKKIIDKSGAVKYKYCVYAGVKQSDERGAQ